MGDEPTLPAYPYAPRLWLQPPSATAARAINPTLTTAIFLMSQVLHTLSAPSPPMDALARWPWAAAVLAVPQIVERTRDEPPTGGWRQSCLSIDDKTTFFHKTRSLR